MLDNFVPHVGGLETEFSEFARRLTQRGHEVRVVTGGPGGLRGEREHFGARVFYFKSLWLYGHPMLPGGKIEPHIAWSDIVHTANYTAAHAALRLANRHHKPCLLTVHEALRGRWLSVEKNVVKALACWVCEWRVLTRDYGAWHVISRATREDLLRYHVDPDKVVLIHLGVDPAVWNPDVPKLDIHEYFGFGKDDRIFLFSGRPAKLKGMSVLFEAVKKVKSVLPGGFRFGFLLSDDPRSERRRLLGSVRKNGLEDLISIRDAVPYRRLPGSKKDCYACIIPSLHEGFGLNAVETSSLGIPLIVSDAPSLPEVVSGKALFFRSNDPSDLADKILRATRNEFENVEPREFSWDAAVDGLIGVYEELVQGRVRDGSLRGS